MTQAAREIKLIQIGRSALGLDEPTYRLLLSNLTGGKTSSKALTPAERQAVLTHMKARGFVVKPSASRDALKAERGWQHEPVMRKLRAMWWTLADAGAVDAPADPAACNAAVEAWALRMMTNWDTKPSALRFANGDQMSKLVEELKAWMRRLKLATD